MSDTNSRFKLVLKTSIVGIVTNVLLATFKTVIGLITNSIAIVSDGINNFSDATSSLITIIATAMAGKEPDKKHPFGHGRLEYLSSLAIAGIILYAGITSFIESVKSIISHETSDYSTVSLVIVGVAVAVKIVLSVYTQKMGKKADSDALIASGKDALLDSVVSLTTLIAALIYIFADISLEAWLAAVISLLIVKTGIEVLKDTVSKILGEPADIETVIDIKKTIASFEGVNGAYDLVVNDYGPGRQLASVHIEIDSTFSVDMIDRLARKITDTVMKKHGVYLTAIGIYSKNLSDKDVHDMEMEIRKLALSCEMVKGMHGFYLDKEDKDVRFDLVISLEKGDRRSYYNKAVETIREKYPDYTFTVGMDVDFNELGKQ